MAEHPFQFLLALVNLDQTMQTDQTKIQLLEQEQQQAQEQEAAINAELEQAKRKFFTARKNVDTCELEIKELAEQEKQKRARLGESSKYKELQSLNTELEHLQDLQQACEERLLQAWNVLEHSQKQYEMEQKLFDDRLKELHMLRDKKEAEIASLKSNLILLASQRPEREQKVPLEWLEKYTMMYAHVPDPVVPLLDNSCSACFYQLPTQELIRLQRGALLQCKQCFRLLFMQDVMDKKDNKEH